MAWPAFREFRPLANLSSSKAEARLLLSAGNAQEAPQPFEQQALMCRLLDRSAGYRDFLTGVAHLCSFSFGLSNTFFGCEQSPSG